MFKDTASDQSNQDLIWFVHDIGLDAETFIPHSRSELKPVYDKTIEYPAELILEQIQDAYVGQDHIFIQQLGVSTIHQYAITRPNDSILIGDLVKVFNVELASGDRVVTRSLTGYDNFMFLQVQQDRRALTYDTRDGGKVIESGFNFQPLEESLVHHIDQRQTTFIGTDDGQLLYILLPNGEIRVVASTDTSLAPTTLYMDENSPAGTLVQGAVRGFAQFPRFH